MGRTGRGRRALLSTGLALAAAGCSGGGGGADAPEAPAVSVGFGAASADVAEGGPALDVPVVLHTTKPALTAPLTVDVVDLATGTATSGTDYAAFAPQTVTFPIGAVDGDVRTVSLTTTTDLSIEGADETIRLGLQSAVGGRLAGPATFTATVLDAERATIAFELSTSATVDEADATHSLTVTLALPAGASLDVDARATLLDGGAGSATSGADYAAVAPVPVTFAAGAGDGASQTFGVGVLDDADPEVDETVVLVLTSPAPGTLVGAGGLHTITITDDDGLADAALVVTEGPTGTENTRAHDDALDLGAQTVGAGPNAGTLVRLTNVGGAPLALGAPVLGGAHPNDFAVEIESASTPPPLASDPAAPLGPDLLVPLARVEDAADGEPRPGIAVALDPDGLAALAAHGRATVHGFPVPGLGDVTLDLRRLPSPFTADAVLRVDGAVVPGGPAAVLGDVTLWRGVALEHAGSRVFLAFSSEGARGWLELPFTDRRIVHVVTESAATPAGAPARSRIVHEADLLAALPPPERLCGAALPVPGEESGPEAHAFVPTPETDSLNAADCALAIETDYQLYQRFGSVGATTDYVTQLVAAVSDQYFIDVQATLSIAYLGIYTTPADPWTSQDSGGNASDLLAEFRAAWNANGWPAQANLAHFLSGASLGGGVAYLNVLCNSSYGYGVSGNINGSIDWGAWTGQAASFTWDFVVVAHELGHNFGTGHTHDGYCPPLDHCYTNCDNTTGCSQGTIMSYCHTCGGMDNIDLHFHPVVANLMRQRIQSSCLGSSALLGGDWVQYRVRFNPLTTPGTRDATLEFEHDASNQPQPFRLQLTGTAN